MRLILVLFCCLAVASGCRKESLSLSCEQEQLSLADLQARLANSRWSLEECINKGRVKPPANSEVWAFSDSVSTYAEFPQMLQLHGYRILNDTDSLPTVWSATYYSDQNFIILSLPLVIGENRALEICEMEFICAQGRFVRL